MKNCRKIKNLFIDALESELSQAQQKVFDEHVAECSKCSAEFNQLKKIDVETRVRTINEPGQAYWDSYWKNLDQKIQKTDASLVQVVQQWFSKFTVEHYLRTALATAAVILVLVGIFQGNFNTSVKSVLQRDTQVALYSAASLTDQISGYLEKSKILMTGFSNIETEIETEQPVIPNLDTQRQVSRNLITQANYIKDELDPVAQNKLASLIDDLEVVLLQIANIDSTYDTNTVEMIQYSLERKSILFKINLQEVMQEEKLEHKEI